MTDLRRKSARLLAAKCALEARVGGIQKSTGGQEDHSLSEDIKRKLDKLQEPPPVKKVKPLPAPIDQPGRVREQANKMNSSEIQKDASHHRLGFSQNQVDDFCVCCIPTPQLAQFDEKADLTKEQELALGKKSFQRSVLVTIFDLLEKKYCAPSEKLKILKGRSEYVNSCNEVNARLYEFSELLEFPHEKSTRERELESTIKKLEASNAKLTEELENLRQENAFACRTQEKD